MEDLYLQFHRWFFTWGGAVTHTYIPETCGLSPTIMADDTVSPAQPPTLASIPSTPRILRHNAEGLSDVAEEQNRRFARDIEWKVVGLMPVTTFLNTFLPSGPLPQHIAKMTFSKVPSEPGKESDIYGPLVRKEACCWSFHPSPTHPLSR
jgi:hypothetical protein